MNDSEIIAQLKREPAAELRWPQEFTRRHKMKTLTLSLKKKWFDMIKSGEKKEEYRDNSVYWHRRLYRSTDANDDEFKHFDRLVFTLGYPKADDTERRLTFKNPKIRIGTGRPERGAEPGKQYFVITWEA